MDWLVHEIVIKIGNEQVSLSLCASCTAKWEGF